MGYGPLMNKEKLIELGEWAEARVNSGEEPPWTYQKLRQLSELAFEFAKGMETNFAFTPGLDTDEVEVAEISGENVVRLQTPPRPQMTNLPA